MDRFEFGKRASDYMVTVHPYARHLDDVGRMYHGQKTYVVLKDPGGNHYARAMHDAAPVLTRVYPVQDFVRLESQTA